MHTSPFVSSDPILLEDVEPSEEYDSKDSLHFCEDECSSSPSIECELLPVGPEYIVLDLYRVTTMSFHDKSLEMEKSWAKEFCEAPTLKSNEKDSSHDHGNFALDIPNKPCSFNATPESGTLSAPCTHKDYSHHIILLCKIFRRLVVDVYVYRKHCIFRECTMAINL